jgi:hypothetical protein
MSDKSSFLRADDDDFGNDTTCELSESDSTELYDGRGLTLRTELDDDIPTTDGGSSDAASVSERERFFLFNDFVRTLSVIYTRTNAYDDVHSHGYNYEFLLGLNLNSSSVLPTQYTTLESRLTAYYLQHLLTQHSSTAVHVQLRIA